MSLAAALVRMLKQKKKKKMAASEPLSFLRQQIVVMDAGDKM